MEVTHDVKIAIPQEIQERHSHQTFSSPNPYCGILLSLQAKPLYNIASAAAIAVHPCQIFTLVPTPLS